jgi:hypothetical protein
MKWIIKILVCIMLVCITMQIHSQQYYFNDIYNPNKTWASGLSIIGIDTGYFGCAISSDSITNNYNTCTFVMNENGEILHWNNFGRWGAHYYAGDEGALVQNNNHFGLFTTVEDGVLETDYGIFFKFDQYGDTILTRTFIDETDTFLIGRTCTATNDGGYALLGNNFPVDLADLLLIKTDSNGNEQWRQQYGTDSSDWAKCVIQTADKGFAIGSWTRLNDGIYQRVTADPLVFKTDSLGNLEWTLNLGGPVMDDQAMLFPTQDSCIMVLTTIGDSMYSIEYAYGRINIIKVDLQGNIIWNNKYGISSIANSASNIISLADSGFLACGYVVASTYLPITGWLFRFNSDGDSLWYREYWYYPEDPSYGYNYLRDLSSTSDNGFVTIGEAHTGGPPDYIQKIWVLKVDSVGCEIADCWVGLEEQGGGEAWGQGSAEAGRQGGLEIWPNPASQVISVKCSVLSSGKECLLVVYDVFGREIRKIDIPDTNHEIKFTVEDFLPGLYLVVLKDKNDIIGSAKMVVSR